MFWSYKAFKCKELPTGDLRELIKSGDFDIIEGPITGDTLEGVAVDLRQRGLQILELTPIEYQEYAVLVKYEHRRHKLQLRLRRAQRKPIKNKQPEHKKTLKEYLTNLIVRILGQKQ